MKTIKTILVVEDNQENLDVAKAFFKTVTGFEFIYATNKEDAVAKLPEADALLTDRYMPYFDGAKVDYSPENGYMLEFLQNEGKVVMLSDTDNVIKHCC
jgi:DNA-binding response OmpR family regulator